MAKDTQVTVVMVPFLAQGHLGQLLHLSRLISSYNIPVHYVSTTTHIRQARSRHQGWDLLAHDNIHVHEFPVPAFQCPAPDPNAKIKYPTQLQPAFEASIHLREPVFKLLTSLSATARRIVVIHDYLMASVLQDFVSLPNAETYISNILQQLPSLEGCLSPESMDFWNKQKIHLKNSSGELYNTSRAIEGHYVDLVQQFQVDKKHWAIGPFNPVDILEKPDQQRHESLIWLDNQAPNSVIYVSFGTTTSLTDEQIHAIAVGLERSDQKFIWVLRDADRGDVFTEDVRKSELPVGYEERILEAGQGMIVRGWAPQLEILAHASTKFLTRFHKFDLRNDIKKSVAEGGVSRLELDSFIDHITRSN